MGRKSSPFLTYSVVSCRSVLEFIRRHTRTNFGLMHCGLAERSWVRARKRRKWSHAPVRYGRTLWLHALPRALQRNKETKKWTVARPCPQLGAVGGARPNSHPSRLAERWTGSSGGTVCSSPSMLISHQLVVGVIGYTIRTFLRGWQWHAHASVSTHPQGQKAGERERDEPRWNGISSIDRPVSEWLQLQRVLVLS